MTQPATPTAATAPSLLNFPAAQPDAPQHAYAARCIQALQGCPVPVGMDVLLCVYRHLAMTSPDKVITATAAFATAVLSQELTAAAGVQASPSTLN